MVCIISAAKKARIFLQCYIVSFQKSSRLLFKRSAIGIEENGSLNNKLAANPQLILKFSVLTSHFGTACIWKCTCARCHFLIILHRESIKGHIPPDRFLDTNLFVWSITDNILASGEKAKISPSLLLMMNAEQVLSSFLFTHIYAHSQSYCLI